MKIARISTVMFFLRTQLKKQIDDLVDFGCDVTIIANEDDFEDKSAKLENVKTINLDIKRKISPLNDIKTIFALIKIFKREKFDIVHSTTPKAGLLVAIAAWIVKVPIRLHTFTGQPWIVEKGFKRFLLKSCDKIIVLLNTKCYVDSASQKDILVLNNIGKEYQFHVIGSGSLAGVDLDRFNKDKYTFLEKDELKQKLNISEKTFVLLFVGRITKDKGIYELLSAVEKLIKDTYDFKLIIVGPIENDEKENFNQFMKKHDDIKNHVILIGYSHEPERYMAISNLFCLPSYREGFGTVIIESGAFGVPSIGTDIYGLSDAIVNGKTGLLVPVKDVNAIYDVVSHLIKNRQFYNQLSENTLKRTKEEFDSRIISEQIFIDYQNLIESRV